MQRFTDSQLKLARLIADGLTYEEIGEALGITSRTAKSRTDVLRHQLDVKYKRQIPLIMRELGLI